MKVAICLLACVIGYAYATTCSTNNDCDANITQCSQGYTLTCRQTADSTRHCVCVNGQGGAHACTTQADCHNQHLHHCNNGHWMCDNGHCHCSGGHNNNEGAYDTTWKYGEIDDLYAFGIGGRLAYFTFFFLNDRQFKVCVGDIHVLSNPHEQKMEVP